MYEARATVDAPAGIHIHDEGRCDPPGFASAGGHFAPHGRDHGWRNPQGPHAGDLRNLEVDPDGRASTFRVLGRAQLIGPDAGLLDEDGAALILHLGGDDQVTDPAGQSGPRWACGVIEPVTSKPRAGA